MNLKCPYTDRICTAPDTNCPHWIGTFCELDIEDWMDLY